MRAGRIINNLQVKVTVLFIVVSLVPLGIVSVFSIRSAEQLILGMVVNQLESVAADKLNLIERWLTERKADLKVVADSSIVKSLEPAPIASYLELVQVNYEVYRNFVVVSREGKIIFDNAGRRSDYTSEQWFLEALAGRSHQSGIFLEPGKKESVFQISSPVRDESGEIRGAVKATVGTHAIISIVLRVSLGKTGESYLVDDQGTFLAHNDPKKILSENIARSGSFEKIFHGAGYQIIYTDYRGIEVLGASRHVAGTNWHLVVEQDRDEAFAGVFRLKRYLYAAIVISLVITLILALLLAYYIVKPIQELSGAALALARGEFDRGRMITNRGDEIGALFIAFSEMARQLQSRQDRLEEKVGATEAELKQTDVKLKKTEEAAARSERLAALGRLAAGVTHEIRTPLTSLKLFLQSLPDDVEISPESQEDYRIAMNQISRIEATINRFLDFAKPQEPIYSTIEIKQLIEDSLSVVTPRAIQQEISVIKDLDPGLPLLSGDKKQLGEALLNLMVNALEAMSLGDALTVRAFSDQRKLEGAIRKCVCIEIADTGEGIVPENLEKLFDPFFTTKASGTGLGLSIVNSTVIKHSGEIAVESGIGRGSRFRVYLPVKEDQEPDGRGPDIHR